MRCLEKDPTRRYATAKELGEYLGRFLRFETTRARPRGRVARGLRWCRRRPVHATALGLAIGGIALAIVLSYRTHVAYREAAEANARSENIGARRLHTILEAVLEEISFNASERGESTLEIDDEYVRSTLDPILADQDLAKYIL